MNEEEQKKIFSKNLSRYISSSGKQQKEVAKDLLINPTTFNTWCVGKIIPSMGKVQKIADYFKIGKSDLLDDKFSDESAFTNTRIFRDAQMKRLMTYYEALNETDKKSLIDMAEFLNTKHQN